MAFLHLDSLRSDLKWQMWQYFWTVWVCLLILTSLKPLSGRNQPLCPMPHLHSYTLILQPEKLRHKQNKARVGSDQMLNQTIVVSGPPAFCISYPTEFGCNLHLCHGGWSQKHLDTLGRHEEEKEEKKQCIVRENKTSVCFGSRWSE